MKKVKVKMWAGTRYVGSTVDDELELEIDEGLSESEEENAIEDQFNDWLWNNIDAGWLRSDD